MKRTKSYTNGYSLASGKRLLSFNNYSKNAHKFFKLRKSLHDTENQLITDFRNGDHRAFTQIYQRFQHGLYYYGRRFVGHEDADDAVTEAYVGLWQQRSSFDAIPKIERWLFVTVRNHCISVLRQQVRQHDAKTELLHLLETSQITAFQEEAITTEIIHLLHREIDKLPPKQREIFLLSFRNGLKPAEIAERLSLSVKTVKNQKSSAIRLLQVALGQRAALLALLVILHEDGATVLTI